VRRVLLAALLLLSPAGDPPPGPKVLLAEEFREFSGGIPAGWTAPTGATSGTGPASSIEAIEEGGVLLSGDAETGTWRMLERRVPVPKAAFLRLSAETRARGLRQEARQFVNSWIGVHWENATPAEPRVVVPGEWRREEMLLRVPDAAGQVRVRIFLSMTGSLEVRRLALEVLGPEHGFDAVVRHMDRYYSHRESRGKGWDERAAALRSRALAAVDEEARFEILRQFLAPLGDVHVTLRTSAGKVIPTAPLTAPLNADFRAVAKALKEPKQLGKLALAGIAGNDCGYLAVGSLEAERLAFLPVVDALKGMSGRRGILLDLRGNGGGDEHRARELAALFAADPVVYGRHCFRAGDAPDAFGPVGDRLIQGSGLLAGKPLVVLLGPRCVSSGEALAQMFAAIPGAILAGLPTAGQSGNPQPADLPGGGAVIFSRWVNLMPDGTPLEGRGVLPHREIRHEGPGDPTFVEGLRILEEAIAAAGR
jgi:hypothetical protein